MNYFAFVDESGVLDESSKAQPYFAVGFLRIDDTSKITEELISNHYDYFSSQKQKRKELLSDLKVNPKTLNDQDLNLLLASTRHYEYKFTNVTPTTLEKYKKLVDSAFQHPLHFCVLVIDKTDPLFDSTIYKNYWLAYIKYTKLLCQNNCGSNNKIIMVADYMNRPKNSGVFFEQEINSLPVVLNSLRAHSETFMLIQVCDLLLGSVLFQWRQKHGYVKGSNRAKAKDEFVRYLVNKLVIPPVKKDNFPLAQAITCRDPIYFSVWPLKLSNTKSGGV